MLESIIIDSVYQGLGGPGRRESVRSGLADCQSDSQGGIAPAELTCRGSSHFPGGQGAPDTLDLLWIVLF
jgi:hypothetical protein